MFNSYKKITPILSEDSNKKLYTKSTSWEFNIKSISNSDSYTRRLLRWWFK